MLEPIHTLVGSWTEAQIIILCLINEKEDNYVSSCFSNAHEARTDLCRI